MQADKLKKNNLISQTAKTYRILLVLNIVLSCGLAVSTAFFAVVVGPLLQLFMSPGSAANTAAQVEFSSLLGPIMAKGVDFIWHIQSLPRQMILEALPLLLVVAGTARFLFFVSQWYLIENIGERLAGKIRQKIVNAYLSVDLDLPRRDGEYGSYEDRLYTGITHDIRMIREYFVRFYGGLPREIIQVSVLTATLFIISYKLTFIFLLGIVPFVALISRYGKKIRRRSDGILKDFAALSEWVQQRFLGIETIKHYHSEDIEESRLSHFLASLLKGQEKAANAKAKSSAISEFAAIGAVAIVFAVALNETNSQSLSGAIILNFFTTIAFISQSASKFGKYYNINREASSAVSRTLTLYDYFSENKKNTIWLPTDFCLNPEHGIAVACKNISLHYESSQAAPVINDLSYSFKKGKFYAIYGKTGAGKSTLLKVLTKELVPSQGDVQYSASLKDLKLKFIWVPQRITPIRDLIWQNCVYPLETYDPELLDEALAKAQAKNYIDKLPQKEKTSLLTGRSLSGGEIQRLFIARMFYHAHPLNFIDEGTSALDPQSEIMILGEMQKFVRHGATIVMVAHRQIVKDFADEVLYLENGKLT